MLFILALILSQVDLDNLCRDVMNMILNGDEDGEGQSKSAVGNGYGQNSALVN